MYKWHGTGETYYVNNEGNGWKAGIEEVFMDSPWNTGDRIKMEWDDSGSLKFYRNDTEIGKINIRKDVIYYPCVCRGISGNGEVELAICDLKWVCTQYESTWGDWENVCILKLLHCNDNDKFCNHYESLNLMIGGLWLLLSYTKSFENTQNFSVCKLPTNWMNTIHG